MIFSHISAALDITVAPPPPPPPRLIHLICWKRACTRVFQQRQYSRVKIPSVLSWAGDICHYGAWGPEAWKASSQVGSRLAIRDNTPKSKVVAQLYGCLSLSLIRANTRLLFVHAFVSVCCVSPHVLLFNNYPNIYE